MKTSKLTILILILLSGALGKSQSYHLLQKSFKYTSFKKSSFSNLNSKNFMIIRRPNNFDEGLVWYTDIGFSGNHLSINTSAAWQTYGGWEFGIGLGAHNNQLDIPLNNENDLLDISGSPLFLHCKYFLANFFEGIIKPYVKTAIGYSFNNSEEGVTSGNGFMFENGLGVQFRIGRDYVYCDFSQYNQKAKGNIHDTEQNLDVNFNVWFNDLVFRIGYGRRLIY